MYIFIINLCKYMYHIVFHIYSKIPVDVFSLNALNFQLLQNYYSLKDSYQCMFGIYFGVCDKKKQPLTTLTFISLQCLFFYQ